MKVGILTYHRAHNFGAVLQCYALKSVITSLGHDVQVIDYRQPVIERVYDFHKTFSFKTLLRMPLSKKLDYIKDHAYRLKSNYKKRKENFDRFCSTFLNLSPECIDSIPDVYDAYVIGSDMLWGAECMLGSFEPVYLGKFPHKKEHKIIGYAISSTPNSVERLAKETNFDFLSNFTSISMRESKLAKSVEKYSDHDISVCLDPTLLTNRETWDPLINENWSKRKFILTYYLRVPQDDREAIRNKLKDYEEQGYEILNIDLRPSASQISVEDFVSMIKYARYMITDSFHGVVFSTIFHTPVHAICLHDHGDVRYTNILESLGLESLVVEREFTPYIPDVSYVHADEKLQELQQSSLFYLKNSL